MSLALSLFLTAVGMIFGIVICAEVVAIVLRKLRGRANGSN